MNAPIRRLAVALLAGLALLLVNTTYIQVVRGPSYRDDARNPRVLLAQSEKERGTIVDRNGEILARSVADQFDGRAYSRVYPYGAAFVHSIGFSSFLFGDRGLEDAYAAELRSKEDLTISDLVAALLGRDLRPQSLVTTLDLDLQQVATEALGGQRGAVVALEPSTGAVLAYVSSPGYDPAPLLGADAGPLGDALSASDDEPLLNRADSNTYPPGSVFKIVTAAAALDAWLATPATEFPNPTELALPGSTAVIRNFGGGTCGSGDAVSLAEAFRRSCNTVFGELGLLLGAGELVATAESFGFNRDIPFEWDVLDSAIPAASTFRDDQPGLAQTAIGQRDVQATPLQMALVGAAIANDGLIMEPHLVMSVVDVEGATTQRTEPAEFSRATTPATAAEISAMMEAVVESGTGTGAAISGVRVAGKTGTAETELGAPHAWFVGFAPVDDPQIVVAVLVEAGGDVGDEATGGSLAAPVARRVIATWMGLST